MRSDNSRRNLTHLNFFKFIKHFICVDHCFQLVPWWGSLWYAISCAHWIPQATSFKSTYSLDCDSNIDSACFGKTFPHEHRPDLINFNLYRMLAASLREKQVVSLWNSLFTTLRQRNFVNACVIIYYTSGVVYEHWASWYAIRICETWDASRCSMRFMFVTLRINQIVTGIVFTWCAKCENVSFL